MIFTYKNTFPINTLGGDNEVYEIEVKNPTPPFNADDIKLIKLQVTRVLDIFLFTYCLGCADEADEDLLNQKLADVRMSIYCSVCFNLRIPTNARKYPKILLKRNEIQTLDFKKIIDLLDITTDNKAEKHYMLPLKRFKKTTEVLNYMLQNIDIRSKGDPPQEEPAQAITDGNPSADVFLGYAPHRDITKVFQCFNTLRKTDTTPGEATAQEQPTTTGDGWGGFASDTTPNEATTPGEAATQEQANEVVAIVSPGYSKKTDGLPSRVDNDFARPKYEFSDAAQMIIMYSLNNIIPDYARMKKRGEIASPTDYFLRFEAEDILKRNNSPRGGKQIEALNNAVVELFTYPLKVSRYVKEKPNATPSRRDCYFHFIDYYETDEAGNVTLLQIAPALLTPNHPVHGAFRQYLPVEKAMPGGYKAVANKSDVAEVVNHILTHTKPGDLIRWEFIFNDHNFKDSNKQRIKTRILQNFDKRGYVTEKQKTIGFKYKIAPKKNV